MKYQEILDASIGMIGESGSTGNVGDYAERATYLMGTFCSQCLPVDRKYRISKGEIPEEITVPSCVTLSDSFPLSTVFVPAATYYIAAMLILEENEDISETLFGHYTDAIASIQNDLLASRHSIKNNYPLE